MYQCKITTSIISVHINNNIKIFYLHIKIVLLVITNYVI